MKEYYTLWNHMSTCGIILWIANHMALTRPMFCTLELGFLGSVLKTQTSH